MRRRKSFNKFAENSNPEPLIFKGDDDVVMVYASGNLIVKIKGSSSVPGCLIILVS